ncbi:hypothetical protein [Massilia yuzhufengensis]|nr:hypothetical protein [Massilia yuzhufengensis]
MRHATIGTIHVIGAGFAFRLLALRYALALPVLEADTGSFDEEPG